MAAADTSWESRFIEVYSETMNVRSSCRTAGINRATYYRRLKKSAGFRHRVDDAREDALDVLEEVARARALSGASDRLIEFLLKAHRPEVYGNRIEVTHLRTRAQELAAELGLDAEKILERANEIVRKAQRRPGSA